MSKYIKATKEFLDEARKDFEEALTSGKFPDGKITFSKNIGAVNRKAKVVFTSNAWDKMQALISEFDKEVAWHGVAYRGEDEDKDEYYITDILVYPQEVTGATVNTDQEKYETWLMSHDDDVFNNIRMQGHSHVNMSVLPSSVDTSLYDRLLEQLDDTMFYIFMIWNKIKDKTIKIYDLQKNILFDTSDITVEISEDEENLLDAGKLSEDEHRAVMDFLVKYRKNKQTEGFVKSAKDMVKDKPLASYTGNKYIYGEKSYYGTSYTKPYESGVKNVDNEAVSSEDKKEKKRKGKRKKNKRVKSSCTSLYSSDDYEWDDFNDPFYYM